MYLCGSASLGVCRGRLVYHLHTPHRDTLGVISETGAPDSTPCSLHAVLPAGRGVRLSVEGLPARRELGCWLLADRNSKQHESHTFVMPSKRATIDPASVLGSLSLLTCSSLVDIHLYRQYRFNAASCTGSTDSMQRAVQAVQIQCSELYRQYRFNAASCTGSTDSMQRAVQAVQVQCSELYRQYRFNAASCTGSTDSMQRAVQAVQIQCSELYRQYRFNAASCTGSTDSMQRAVPGQALRVQCSTYWAWIHCSGIPLGSCMQVPH